MAVWRTALRLAPALVICAASIAGGQTLPSEPIALADGKVTVGGDISQSIGSSDPGFFNYTDYDHSALRMLRVDVSASAKVGPHFTLLGELRTENFDSVRPYALYLRIRPWTTRDFDIQVGRIPPTFGAFARRTYATDNPLIGYPLAYQYLTTIRPDSIPASIDELLQKRGLGWRVRYSLGNDTPDHGVPLVSAFRWDTGVQVHGAAGIFTASAAVTAGTVSNPLFTDDNSGRQVAGRVELRPIAGLVIGTSLARGPFVGDAAARAAGDSRSNSLTQTAWGGDAEFSRGYYLFRFETIVSNWTLPIVSGADLSTPLRSVSTSIEGRYKILPGLYAAGRVDHLGFSDVVGTLVTESWDAPVTRVEVGGGFSIQRNLLLKLTFQHDARDRGLFLPQVAHMTAAQLVFWF